MDETDKIGVNFMYSAYAELQQMTSCFIQHYNLVLELSARTGGVSDLSKIDEAYKERMTKSVQDLRFYLYKVYLNYLNLNSQITMLNEADKRNINSAHEHFTTSFGLKRELIEPFVILQNKIFVNDKTLKKLLENSESMISSIYSTEKKKEDTGKKSND